MATLASKKQSRKSRATAQARKAAETRERLHLLIASLLETIEFVQDAVDAATNAGLIGQDEGRRAHLDLDLMWHQQPGIRLHAR